MSQLHDIVTLIQNNGLATVLLALALLSTWVKDRELQKLHADRVLDHEAFAAKLAAINTKVTDVCERVAVANERVGATMDGMRTILSVAVAK